MDGSWGQVPMGCSAKFGRVPYYKTGTEPPGYGPGCTLSDYQPVCVSHPGMFNIRFYFIFLRMKSIRFTLLLDEQLQYYLLFSGYTKHSSTGCIQRTNTQWSNVSEAERECMHDASCAGFMHTCGYGATCPTCPQGDIKLCAYGYEEKHSKCGSTLYKKGEHKYYNIIEPIFFVS